VRRSGHTIRVHRTAQQRGYGIPPWSQKVDPQLNPLRKEPRFRAIERVLKSPN